MKGARKEETAMLMGQHRAAFPDNRMRSVGKEYYEWKIYNNPVKVGGIYLETRDGRVVGSSTAMPRKIAVLDKASLGAELGDSFTLPEYRRNGINSKALKECMDYALSHGMNLIYGPPNEANYRLHIKLGFAPCTYIGWASLSKSFHHGRLALRLAARILRGKNVSRNYRELFFLLRGGVSKLHSARKGTDDGANDFSISKVDRFTNRVDPLWGRPRYSFFVWRDSRYLNWRYFHNPDRFTVLAAVRDDEYLGYLAVKMAKDNCTGILCDFVTVNDRPDVFVALVKESERVLKEDGAEGIILKCISDSPYYKELREMGYYDPGPERYHQVVIYAGTEEGRKILENPGKWHFTFGDTDEL